MNRLYAAIGPIKGAVNPADIKYTGNWYLISHVAESLIRFDHSKNQFIPSLAESWTHQDNRYSFKIRSDAKFHDGSRLTALDVAASFKNLIIRRTSAHFPVWEYFENCESLASIEDDCPGIKVTSENEIEFYLKEQAQSFFLLLASPEGSIWKSQELIEDKLESYSGPYFIAAEEDKGLLLKKNPYSRFLSDFPNAPEEIFVYTRFSVDVKGFIESNPLDVFLSPTRPFSSYTWSDLGYETHGFTPSNIIHFVKIGIGNNPLTEAFFKNLWDDNTENRLMPADTFLPFSSITEITRDNFLDLLPPTSNSLVRIASVEPYFADEFHHQLESAAKKAGLRLEIEVLPPNEWLEVLNGSKENPKYDFIISSYVASERFPSVQLRYMAQGHEIPYDLSEIDKPIDSPERHEHLYRVQSWMIEKQLVLPAYFTRSEIAYSPKLDIGNQPVADTEIQMWRFQWR